VIAEWWRRWPEANIGLATGDSSGVDVLDVDPRHGGEDSLHDIEANHGELPATLVSLTGGGGVHCFFHHTPGLKNSAGKIGPGIDFRADGGYVIVPPSNHISGRAYTWKGSARPEEIDVVPIPEYLLKLARESTNANGRNGKSAGRIPEVVADGSKHDTIVSLAGSVRSRGLPREGAFAACRALQFESPVSDAEIWERVNSIYDLYEPAAPTPDPPITKESRTTHTARPDRRAAARLAATDGYEVFNGEYPEPVFLVADLVTTGLTLFCGRPKVGKSWFTLSLAIAVALSKKFLDHFNVERPGRVTYVALEESAARTHRRLRKLIAASDVGLQNIGFIYNLEPLLAQGAVQLDEYLAANPSELVVVDSLLSILQASGKRDVLRSDYAESTILRQLAEKHKTAIVVVHHTRKMAAENHIDTVAGTTGVTAGADAIWTLDRLPGGDFILRIKGRDMPDKEYGMRFVDGDPFGWKVIGEGNEIALSEERQEILELLKEEAPLKPARIAAMLKKKAVAVRRLLQKLYADGLVEKNRDGAYVLGRAPGAV
jgi:hypothetical protein